VGRGGRQDLVDCRHLVVWSGVFVTLAAASSQANRVIGMGEQSLPSFTVTFVG
jgi:hypothetical protein